MTTTTISTSEELERFEFSLGTDSALIRDGASDAWIGASTDDGLYCIRLRTEDDEYTNTSGYLHGWVVSCPAQDLPLPLTITTEEA